MSSWRWFSILLLTAILSSHRAQAGTGDMFGDWGFGPQEDWVPQAYDTADMFPKYEPYVDGQSDMFDKSENVYGFNDMFEPLPREAPPDIEMFAPPESFQRRD